MEIKSTLHKYGADNVASGQSISQGVAFVAFTYKGLPLSIRLFMPDRDNASFTTTPGGQERSEAQARKMWEGACRQQWRVLSLIVKANLEAVENGVFSAEEVFLPWLVLPSGERVIDHVRPQLAAAMVGGQMKALPFGGGEKGSVG